MNVNPSGLHAGTRGPSREQTIELIKTDLANLEKRMEILQGRHKLIAAQRDARRELTDVVVQTLPPSWGEYIKARDWDCQLTVRFIKAFADLSYADADMLTLTISELESEMSMITAKQSEISEILRVVESGIIVPRMDINPLAN
jgi:hypothetical protein